MTAIPPEDKSFLIKFIVAVGLALGFFITVTLLVTSCAPKPSNEISEMALECMRNQSSIIITFTPSHEEKYVPKNPQIK